MPKDWEGIKQWFMSDYRAVWTFPPAPCPWLCGRNLKRFHFTCLTCWTRRLYFKKRGYEKLVYRKKIVMANKPPTGQRGMIQVKVFNSEKPVALPLYYTNYGIFLPTNGEGKMSVVKMFFVKYLLTLVERIAEL
jgi:hypothetical protein